MNYTFKYTNAATVYALSSNVTGIPSLFPPQLDDSQIFDISFSSSSLSLDAHDSVSVEVGFTLRDGVDESLIPIYSGSIQIQSSAPGDGTVLQVPYMGVAANMTAQQLFDVAEGFPIFRSENPLDDRDITSDGAIFTMNLTTLDIPAVIIRLLLPTRVLLVDILPPDPTDSNATVFAGLETIG